MPTQKSSGFLFNFLAAFRAHNQPIPKPQSSRPTTTTVTTQSQTLWTSTTTTQQPHKTPSSENITSPRPIHPKAAAQQQHTYTTSTSPSSAATTTTTTTTTTAAAGLPSTSPTDLRPALQHNVTPQTHLPRRTPSPGTSPVYGPPNKPSPSYPTAAESRRTRRGSDSSSDSGGFREVMAGGGGGGEKWFVGGRTANGEERYYKLGLVRRERSADRRSADQLSL